MKYWWNQQVPFPARVKATSGLALRIWGRAQPSIVARGHHERAAAVVPDVHRECSMKREAAPCTAARRGLPALRQSILHRSTCLARVERRCFET